jgi:hypothetical protein
MENITLDEWNDEMTLNLIPDTLMLAVYLIVGICGNSIEIVVYAIQMNEVNDERYFIPILATSDLIAVLYCTIPFIQSNIFHYEHNAMNFKLKSISLKVILADFAYPVSTLWWTYFQRLLSNLPFLSHSYCHT